MSALGHVGYMLSLVANNAMRRQVEVALKSPVPLLGQGYIKSSRIDSDVYGTYSPSVGYRAYRDGRGEYPEPVSLFSYSDMIGMPHIQSRDNRKEFKVKNKAAYAGAQEHVQVLQSLGCKTVGVGLHSVIGQSVEQYSIYIPQLRIIEQKNGVLRAEQNIDDQKIFMMYLAEQGFISMPRDHVAMIDAVNSISVQQWGKSGAFNKAKAPIP